MVKLVQMAGKTVVTAVLFSVVCVFCLFLSSCGAKQNSTDTNETLLKKPEAEIKANDAYMTEAIAEALTGIYNGHGGPFGCVIVKDGKIVGRGHNMVLKNNDSTAHGEISAIRDAEQALGTYDLTGCVLYTTGEPCPMCLYAILWANIDKVYYGCTIEDNASIGFRDEVFDDLAGGRDAMKDFLTCIDRDACLELFRVYNNLEHSIY